MSDKNPVPHLWKSLTECDARTAKLHDATMLLHVWGLLDVDMSKDIFDKIQRWSKGSTCASETVVEIRRKLGGDDE